MIRKLFLSFVFSVSCLKCVTCLGESCFSNFDCSRIHEKLVCRNNSLETTTTTTTCQCPTNHFWSNSTCMKIDSEDELLINLFQFFAPLLTFGLLFTAISLACCYFMSSPSEIMATKSKYLDESESKMKDFNIETGKLPTDKRSSSAGSTRYTELNEIPIRNIIKDSQTRVSSAGMTKPKISVDFAPLRVGEMQPDAGYQATMKLLLDRPGNTSEPNSRPISAVSYQPGFYRSESATNMTRQTSLTLLVPRDSSRPSSALSSNGRRSPVVTGPYLTDPSTLRLLQKRSDKYSLTNFIGLQNDENQSETSFIEMDVVRNNLLQNLNKTETLASSNPKASPNVKKDQDTKLVRAAIDAFKQKKRLKDLPKDERTQTKKMETVVEKIMRMRVQQTKEDTNKVIEKPKIVSSEEKVSYNPKPNRATKKAKNVSKSEQSSPVRKVSFYDELSSLGSYTSSRSDGQSPRPESVAQRILRERKEKNIEAKVPETPADNQEKFKKVIKKTVIEKKKPLHIALKESADKKEVSKATMKERIKEEVRFNAVITYEAPKLPESYFKTVNEVQKKGPMRVKSDPGVKPIKSILKNPSAKTHRESKDSSSTTEIPIKEKLSTKSSIQVVAQVY